jgi:serine/threonine-protein kinase HipA
MENLTRESVSMPDDPLFLLHDGLPREGPGSDACTAEALHRLPPLPADPVVLDLGCGPGRSALVLAETLRAKVIAVDLHAPYLDRLARAAAERGLSHLIEPRLADMAAPGVGPGSVDLIWSEGSAYALGFAEALRLWRPLLKPGGLTAVSECSWLVDDPADEPRAFWASAYPAMGTVAENRRRAGAAGLEVLETFVLPASAWWDEYYSPLLDRIAALRPSADAGLAAILDEAGREIDLFRRHGGDFGYVFYLLRACPPRTP